MDKYAQLKRFHQYLQIQVYIFSYMYVDTKTIPVEDNFTATKTFVVNYKKISTPGIVPKYWLGFSYIRSKGDELNQKFDDTSLKKNQTTYPTIKLKQLPKVSRSLRKTGLMI